MKRNNDKKGLAADSGFVQNGGRTDRGGKRTMAQTDDLMKQVAANVRAAQGGDARVAESPATVLPQAPAAFDVAAPRAGYLSRVDADGVGRAVLLLGGGRRAVTDAIDPAVGVSALRKVGDRVERGEPLATVHARSRAEAEALAPQLLAAFAFSDEPVPPRPLVL